MKITELKTFPVADAEGNQYFFVKVYTDAGIDGIGEVGIRNWGNAIGSAVDHLSEVLVGEDPWSTEKHWQKMFRGNFFPADKVYMCAISAIDIALWDIKGKALDQPVHMLLGGKMRDRVTCYTGIGGRTPDETAASARARVAEGWEYLRLSVYDRDGVLEPRAAVRDSLDHFAAARQAVGPETEICIDFHTRLDPPDAIQLGRGLEPLSPFFIEDPLRCENPQSYRQLRRHVSCPLAVGEHYATKWDFRQMIEEELLDYAASTCASSAA